jgi:hypothetical protein
MQPPPVASHHCGARCVVGNPRTGMCCAIPTRAAPKSTYTQRLAGGVRLLVASTTLAAGTGTRENTDHLLLSTEESRGCEWGCGRQITRAWLETQLPNAGFCAASPRSVPHPVPPLAGGLSLCGIISRCGPRWLTLRGSERRSKVEAEQRDGRAVSSGLTSGFARNPTGELSPPGDVAAPKPSLGASRPAPGQIVRVR